MGLTVSPPVAIDLGSISSECNENFVVNLRQFIWGTNNDNPLNSCIPSNRYLTDTDILVIRRLALDPLGSASELKPGEIYVRSAVERGEMFLFNPAQGLNPPTFTEQPAFDYKVETHVYYLSPCISPSDCETPAVPALYRVTLGPGPAMTTHELIATGVENFQVQYGRLINTDMQFFDADEISGSSTATAPTDWDGVVAVRIWLLVRGSVKDQGYTNSETYQLGDKEITVNDNFSRRVFDTVIALRN
jgi:hypothetical protein